jgi:hypothetical protein
MRCVIAFGSVHQYVSRGYSPTLETIVSVPSADANMICVPAGGRIPSSQILLLFILSLPTVIVSGDGGLPDVLAGDVHIIGGALQPTGRST